MIVKKLNEEEEYRPKAKKIPFELIPLNQQKLIPKYQLERVPSSSMKNSKVSVEVVGSNNLITNPFQQNLTNSTRTDFIKNEFSLDSSTNPQFFPQQTMPSSRPAVVLSLSEKNYLQIIDNLTSRYGSAGADKKLNESSNNKKVIQIHENSNNKETARDLLSLEFINDLGINTDQIASNHHQYQHQQQYAFSYNDKNLLQKKNLKQIEKKYFNPNSNFNDLNIFVNNSTNINNKKEVLPQIYSSLSTSSLMQFTNNTGTYVNKELNSKYETTSNRKTSRVDKIPSYHLNNQHSHSNQGFNLLASFQNNENLSQSKLQSLGGGYYYTTITNVPNTIKSLTGIKANMIDSNISINGINNKLRQNRNFIVKDTRFVQMVKPLSPLFRDTPGSANKKFYSYDDLNRDDYNTYAMFTPSTPTHSITRLNQEI